MSSTSRNAIASLPLLRRGLAQVGLDDARVGAHLGGLALGDLLAVVEHGDVLGDAHDDLHVVLDQHDRDAALVAQLVHELRELVGLLRVHAGRRLVEQQQLRVGGQRAGDLDPPLVAVGEVDRGPVVMALGQPDVARAPRAPSPRRAPPPCARRACGRSSRTGPAFMRAFWPTMQFSTAVIVANRRMFWNVRAMPELHDHVGPPAGDVAAVEHDPARASACRSR